MVRKRERLILVDTGQRRIKPDCPKTGVWERKGGERNLNWEKQRPISRR